MELTDKNYKELLNQYKDKLVILDFWAPWCKPCNSFSKVLEEVEKEFKDKVVILKYNIESEEKLVIQYSIRNIPTLIYMKNNEIILHTSGTLSKAALIEKIKSLLLI